MGGSIATPAPIRDLCVSHCPYITSQCCVSEKSTFNKNAAKQAQKAVDKEAGGDAEKTGKGEDCGGHLL